MKIENGVITDFEQDTVLTIPKDAESLEWDVLESNEGKAEKIVVEADNKKFATNGTVLIDKGNKSIVLGLSNAEIPTDESVEVIDREAFLNRVELKKISLPNTIKGIGYRAISIAVVCNFNTVGKKSSIC